jgi:hypothetical protein
MCQWMEDLMSFAAFDYESHPSDEASELLNDPATGFRRNMVRRPAEIEC